MIARLARALRLAISIVAVGISASVFASGSVRQAFVLAGLKKLSLIMPPEYAFAGDSLTARCDWRWRISQNPLSVVNLAVEGAVIRQISDQVSDANIMRARFVMIDAGINDVFQNTPVDQLERDFEWLLRQVGAQQKGIVTLIPYISDAAFSERIANANRSIVAITKTHGVPVIDLNAQLASDGVRRPEMTTDGIHFSRLACSIWIKDVRRELNRSNPAEIVQCVSP